VHEQKGLVIAVAVAALGLSNPVSAQKDAAEKAQEGAIDHWIEYYKSERSKHTAPAPQAPVASPFDRTAPVQRSDADASPKEKKN
jgi:hypothetical protein